MKKKKICGIYKITSPSGRIYIGQSKDIEQRWGTYRCSLAKTQRQLRLSFEKYGIENHTFEIVKECIEDELNQWEGYYINLFECCDQFKGLNSMTGGHSTKMTPELRKRLSNIKKEIFKNDRDLYNRTVEMLKSVPKSGRDNAIYGTGKSFLKFDLELNLVGEYKSKFDITEENPLDGINVYKCCNRHKLYKTIKGFIWRFKDDCIVENGKLIEDIKIKDFTKASKYKGVKYLPKENIWFASYWSKPLKKYLYIGRFKTEIEAYRAYLHFKEQYENFDSYSLFVQCDNLQKSN